MEEEIECLTAGDREWTLWEVLRRVVFEGCTRGSTSNYFVTPPTPLELLEAIWKKKLEFWTNFLVENSMEVLGN